MNICRVLDPFVTGAFPFCLQCYTDIDDEDFYTSKWTEKFIERSVTMEEGQSDVIIIGQGQQDQSKVTALDSFLPEATTSTNFEHVQQGTQSPTVLSRGVTFLPKLPLGQKSQDPYSCERCLKVFTCYADWYYHRNSHNTNHRFRCQLCNSGFDTLEKYKSHHEDHKREYQNMKKP